MILPRVSYGQAKRELLRAISTALRGHSGMHYLDDVTGGGKQSETKLTASFTALARTFAAMLQSADKDLRLQVLLLNALCQRYRPEVRTNRKKTKQTKTRNT